MIINNEIENIPGFLMNTIYMYFNLWQRHCVMIFQVIEIEAHITKIRGITAASQELKSRNQEVSIYNFRSWQ